MDTASVSIQATSITLNSGSQLYIYGFATGGCCPTGDFQSGQYAAVNDLDGFRIASLAVTSSNTNSYPSQTAYNTIGGVGVSGYSSYTSSFQTQTGAGPDLSVSDSFSVTTSNSLVVLVAIGGGSQCQQLSGISNLQTDALTSNANPIITIAHAYLNSGSYTAKDDAQQCAAGQDPNHAGDLIGVFIFIPGTSSGNPPTFQDLTSQVSSTGLCCWVAQSLYASTTRFSGYLTVGGNGLSIYSTTASFAPPDLSGSGYLTGASSNGSKFLLVGQHYSPQGGVLMFSYDPATNTATNISGLFDPSLSTDATLLEASWTGSIFYILGLKGSEVSPGQPVNLLLFTYDPLTGLLTDVTNLLPSQFQSVVSAAQEIAWTPSGLFLMLQGSSGALFGVLDQQTFTDLTPTLPNGFSLSNSNGFLTPVRSGYTMTWDGSNLFIAGESSSQATIALLKYSPSTSQIIDLSSSLASFQGSPVSLANSNGVLYISGFTQTSTSSTAPILLGIDVSSMIPTSLSGDIPSSFGAVTGLAVNNENLFLAGGSFNHVVYGLLTQQASSVQFTSNILYQGAEYSVTFTVPQTDYQSVSSDASSIQSQYPNMNPTLLTNSLYLTEVINRGTASRPINGLAISKGSQSIGDATLKSQILYGLFLYSYLLITQSGSSSLSNFQTISQQWQQIYSNGYFLGNVAKGLAIVDQALQVLVSDVLGLLSDVKDLYGGTTSDQVSSGISLFFELCSPVDELTQHYGATISNQIVQTLIGQSLISSVAYDSIHLCHVLMDDLDKASTVVATILVNDLGVSLTDNAKTVLTSMIHDIVSGAVQSFIPGAGLSLYAYFGGGTGVELSASTSLAIGAQSFLTGFVGYVLPIALATALTKGYTIPLAEDYRDAWQTSGSLSTLYSELSLQLGLLSNRPTSNDPLDTQSAFDTSILYGMTDITSYFYFLNEYQYEASDILHSQTDLDNLMSLANAESSNAQSWSSFLQNLQQTATTVVASLDPTGGSFDFLFPTPSSILPTLPASGGIIVSVGASDSVSLQTGSHLFEVRAQTWFSNFTTSAYLDDINKTSFLIIANPVSGQYTLTISSFVKVAIIDMQPSQVNNASLSYVETLTANNTSFSVSEFSQSGPLLSTESTYFTDASGSPLQKNAVNSIVNVVLNNGRVKSTNPGQIEAWSNFTDLAGGTFQSISLNETLPSDWYTHPVWMPSDGAIHVYIELVNGTLLEVTDPATISVAGSNPQILHLNISNLNTTALGRPLVVGESILVSVKMTYGLIGTGQSLGSYPRKYAQAVSMEAWANPFYSGVQSSLLSSASFAAYAKVPGDVNGDGIVNILDLALVAYSWGTHPGDALWNFSADVLSLGAIDIRDLAYVAYNYGNHA